MRMLILLSLALGLAAQDLNWRLESTGGPDPRNDGALAHDPVGAQLFVFGGLAGSPLDDLWRYSLSTRQWSLVSTTHRPPARFGHTLDYDPVRRRLILFGGEARGFFSDVWAFDIAAGAWSQLAPDNAGPSRRYGHSAVLDRQRNRLVITHGFTSSGRFDDTWAFDLASNTWRDISPPASGRPLRRCLQHAVYDGASTMYMFGGCASGFGPCPLADLWAFDLTAQRWTELRATPAPAGRQHYGLTFDTTRSRLVLFSGSGRGLLADSWEFDPAARQWRQLPAAANGPAPRSRQQGVFAAGVNYFFGGSTANGPTNELWALGAAAPSAAVVNAFSGAGGPVAPGAIVTLFGAGFDAGELRVTFNGVPAPVLFSSPQQINAQTPYEISGQSDAIIQITAGGSQWTINAPIQEAAPGLHPLAFPAAEGIVVFYATGAGVVSPAEPTGASAGGPPHATPAAPVRLTIGGREATLLFAGRAPGTIGVIQINARLPEGATEGDSVEFTVGRATATGSLKFYQ